MNGLVTIVIPTFNRYDRLSRLLNYYRSCNYGYQILVLDSSEKKEKTSRLRQLLSSNNLDYIEYPTNILFGNKISFGMAKVTTPYVLICADDDFISYNGIKKTIKFLENNLDYASVQGYYVRFFNTINNEFSVKVAYPHSYHLDIDENLPSERCYKLLSNYMHTIYSLYRTDDMLYIWNIFEKTNLPNIHHWVELCPSFISVMKGKHKVLPVFWSARETIEGSAGTLCDELWVSMNKYPEDYQRMINILSGQLSIHEGTNIDTARKNILRSLKQYLPPDKNATVLQIVKYYSLIIVKRTIEKISSINFRKIRIREIQNELEKDPNYRGEIEKIRSLVQHFTSE